MEIRGGNQFLSPELLISASGFLEGKKVGYLGCGSSGIFTIALARAIGGTGKLYAVDVLQSAVESTMREVNRNNITNVVPVIADAERGAGAAIPPGSLDMVFLINMLFQNKNRAAIISEAGKLLAKNGKLAVVDWIPTQTSIGPAVEMRVSPDQVRELAAAVGLKAFKDQRLGDFHYLSIFKK